MMDEMELKHEFPNENQCSVCLSVGRKLFYLDKYTEVFRKVTANLEYQNQIPLEELQLCWECHAFVRRINIFIQRVNKANELFSLGQNHIYGTQSNLTTIILLLNDCHPQTLLINDVTMATGIKPTQCNNREENVPMDDSQSDIFIEDVKIEEIKEKTEQKKPKNNRWAIKRAIQNKKPKFKIVAGYTKDSFKKIQISEEDLRICLKSEIERENFISKRFKCDTCVLVFENEDFMQKHVEKFHDQSKPYTCDICKSRISNKRHLARHIRNHYNKYACTVCDFTTCDKTQRQSHYKKQHGKVFECIKCGLKFSRRREFFKHYKDWHEKFICDHCGISFKMRYCIKDHIKKKHSPFECKTCNRRFSRYNALWLHKKTSHSIGTPHYCVECDTHYADVYRYTWHLANSARHARRKEYRIPCPGCDKIFSKNIYMKDHYNLVHLKHFKYRCEECNKNFIRNADLVKHKRRVHEGILPPKNKICYMCGRGFSTNKILTNHVRTHTGEKPYACDICSARFTQRPALTAHARAIHATTDNK